jgi:N-acetylneuraminate synthase
VYKDASIGDEWTEKLKQKCDEYEIEYMTSPYNFEAVDLVNDYVNAFKIGSGDITWTIKPPNQFGQSHTNLVK